MIINKIIAVEGLDKTGKSTFCDNFELIYNSLNNRNTNAGVLKKHNFPSSLSPIGKQIRNELNSLNPDKTIISTPSFLSEMNHFWMMELFQNHKLTKEVETIENNKINKVKKPNTISYIFDRYYISTIAYQAFYNNSQVDLDFIKTSLKINNFLKPPTDIIFLDLPNEIILERTITDQENNSNDSNDTLDEAVINKRRDAYKQALNFLKGTNINIHWFEDISKINQDDLIKILMGKIFN